MSSLTGRINSTREVPGLSGYTLLRELNHGYFGRVYEAQDRSGQKHALKIIEKRKLTSRQKDNVLNEVKIMRMLNHRNVIRFHDFADLSQHYVIAMELMSGGDLFERLEKQTNFTEDDAREIIAQVAEGVKYLHDNNVAHRDIKIENLMFTSHESKVIKIGDFGLAKTLANNSETTVTPCGTKEYMAPEMLDGTHHYNKNVDIWALGCLTYIVLFGGFPFYNDQDDKGKDVINMKEKIQNGRFAFPTGKEPGANVTEVARDLIRHCLVVNPKQRYTIDMFLQHTWIRTRRESSPMLSSPAILRETNIYVPGLIHNAFNISIQLQREQQQPLDMHRQIHQPALASLGGITESQILKRRQREQSKRKADLSQGAGSPLDGEAEEVGPDHLASSSSSSSSTSSALIISPATKKLVTGISSDMVL